MKRLLPLLLVFILCMGLFAFTSCIDSNTLPDNGSDSEAENGDSTQDPTDGTPKDSDKGDLIVGLDDSFPPMGFRDEQYNIVGFDIDFAVEAITRMGYTPVLQPIEWSNKILELNNGTIDVIWNGFTITDGRKKEVLFTKPYLANAQVLVVKADSDIETKADLAGKSVSSQSDSAGLEALVAATDITDMMAGPPVEYPDYVSALNDLKIGRTDAVVIDLVVADYYMAKEPGAFRTLEEELSPEEYGIGVKMGNEDLLEELQAAIDSMIEDGKAAEISEFWFGVDKVLK